MPVVSRYLTTNMQIPNNHNTHEGDICNIQGSYLVHITNPAHWSQLLRVMMNIISKYKMAGEDEVRDGYCLVRSQKENTLLSMTNLPIHLVHNITILNCLMVKKMFRVYEP